MAANKLELRLIATGPAPGGSGEAKNIYMLVTNDTKAQVEADGYLDGVFDNGLKKGDTILAALDIDGTPVAKHYLVSAGGADVAIKGIGLTVTALTYNLVAGAGADNALAAIANPADAPGTADALRDDLVTNALPAIRNNFEDLAAKIEELRAAISV